MTLIQINDTIINLDRVEKITFVPCGRHPGDERDSLAGPILYIDFQPVRDIDGATTSCAAMSGPRPPGT